MSHTSSEAYANINFLVEIDGITRASFGEVLIPAASIDVIEYREGSDNGTVRKLPGLVRYENLVLKWGTSESREMYDWWHAAVRGDLERRNMSVILLNARREELKRWNFLNAWPSKYRPGPLLATGNSIHIESMEIVHEGMVLA